ncbi:CTP synthase (glutamine hydrolyzing) [archaeon]|jgi:CTP synthase|nr:CTP synthase (glutamine hydrolyzing) [archaeon]MBT4351730.1 CTP synthase (glutamine hydrolyzing) [archaeon]MBT4646761.1 CTP synthase (glutamine hydrolyzing) [archaeon]MBT6822054.1 CTP synthase (glutamine hydrolyzing) [archaeon]MBT7391440.1 CTP synthase (glutamine hydrolyzing) [archaeon]
MSKELLDTISDKSVSNEFYTPIPKGYEKGKSKYVIILGTVMSGLGKGIFSSSLGLLLKQKGLKVAPIKFDGYLNQDAGTLNPFRHGEVFVLDDGTEGDMDLGTYERFLGMNISKNNYMTGGKIFQMVLNKERKGKYLGRDVQFIPHVTGEIKYFLRSLAMKSDSDVVLFEIGGTVGDIENNYCIEAVRQLMYEEGKENVSFVGMTYVLEPNFLKEQKSKAAQMGMRSLMSLGIQPDIVACRAQNEITTKIREKISVYSNVEVENVISVHDVPSIYYVPELLKNAKIDSKIIEMLNLKNKENTEWDKWSQFVNNIKNPKKEVIIGITGKYTTLKDSYASIMKSLEHAGSNNEVKVKIKWIETTDISNTEDAKKYLSDVDGIIVPGGFGSRGTEGMIKCIEYVRTNNIPFLGICYGMQMAVIEYARNMCGLDDANSTEINPDCKIQVIDILPEQKKIEGLGGNMRLGGHDILIKKDTLAYSLYSNKEMIRERFRHRWEVNPKYIPTLEENGMVFSGKAPKYPIMQIMELKDHPYFIGGQYHPEFTSRPLQPNPLFNGLVKAAIEKK